jgi:hypothetical protein
MMIRGFRQFRWKDQPTYPLRLRGGKKKFEMDQYSDTRETYEAFGQVVSLTNFLFHERGFARAEISYVFLTPDRLERLSLTLSDLWGAPSENVDERAGQSWRTWVSDDKGASARLSWSKPRETQHKGKLIVELTIQNTELMREAHERLNS